MSNNETWVIIDGYHNYMVSIFGRVKSIKRNIIMTPTINKYGYQRISLFSGGQRKDFSVHRLVATAFIPNQDNKPQVNHKNGIKSDNRESNLEWNTRKENTEHARATGLWDLGVKGELLNIEDGTIIKFSSIRQLGEHLSLTVATIIPSIIKSKKYPIFGTYTVLITDKELSKIGTIVLSSTKTVYAYDYVSGVERVYNSLTDASLRTSIPAATIFASISVSDTDVRCVGGYTFSYTKCVKHKSLSKTIASHDRVALLSKPVRKHNRPIEVRDNETNIVKTYHGLRSLSSLLGVTISQASRILLASERKKTPTLARGYSVRFGDTGYDWTEPTFIELTNSINKANHNSTVFRVTDLRGEVSHVSGTVSLGKEFNMPTGTIDSIISRSGVNELERKLKDAGVLASISKIN